MGTHSAQQIIFSHYESVNFSLLPLQLEEVWRGVKDDNGAEKISSLHDDSFKTRCYSELARFGSLFDFYSDFTATYEKRTARDAKLRDQFDLVAYMIRNSRLAEKGLVDCSDVSIMFALEYIDNQITPVIPDLFAERKRGAEELYRDQIAIHHYLWEKDREQLYTLSEFLKSHDKSLIKPQPFINMEHSYENVVPASLFHRLPLCDQIEIANGDWRTVDLQRRSTQYLVAIKLLFDCSMHRELHKRHPYLVARWANLLEIAQYILRQVGDSEDSMRVMAHSYALVSGVSVAELTSKCLILQNFLKKGMINIEL